MRRGLRLMDWAVVIAIAGLTLAICIPAINSNRQLGCGRSCQNNERQIGLAFLEYANHHGVFPPSTIESTASRPGPTCFLLAMPELDEQELYNAYNFSLENWSG